MDSLALLVAAALPVASTVAVARASGRRMEAFFTALVGASGSLGRQWPIIKFGLGLDDLTYSSWDVLPGLAALGRPLDDPELDRLRQVARRWATIFGVQFFVGLGLAVWVSGLLAVTPLIPGAAAFFSWIGSQYVVFRHALWASRPELREYQESGTKLYLVTAEVVVVLLTIVGVIVFVAVRLRG